VGRRYPHRSREVTPSLQSPPRITLLPFSDITDWQVGITIGERRLKRTRKGTGSMAGLPQQPHLMPITSDPKGTSILPVLTELTHLPGVPHVLLGFVAAMTTMARSCSSSPIGTEPLPKKAHGAFLGVYSRHVCRASYPLCGFCSSHLHISPQSVIFG
jgi:hypothetical protein